MKLKEAQSLMYSRAQHQCEVLPTMGRHLFCRKGCFTNEEEILAEIAECDVISSLIMDGHESSVTVESFVSKLCVYEASIQKKSNHISSRILETLEIMIPSNLRDEYFLPVATDIMEHCFSTDKNGILPFFVLLKKRGKARYLELCISERYYFPEGREIEIRATSDYFRDPKTGRRCKEDSEDAVLCWRKGDVRRKETIYFTTKERFFRVNDGAFHGLISKVKRAMRHVFNDYCKDERTTIFPRLSYDKMNIYAYLRAVKCNALFSHAEESCNDMIYTLKMSGIYETVEAQVDTFINYWRERLLMTEGSVRMKNRSFHFNIDFSKNVRIVERNLELLEDSFDLAFQRFRSSLFLPLTIDLV